MRNAVVLSEIFLIIIVISRFNDTEIKMNRGYASLLRNNAIKHIVELN